MSKIISCFAVGEQHNNYREQSATQTFFRLERFEAPEGYPFAAYDIADFVTVNNGNRFIEYGEQSATREGERHSDAYYNHTKREAVTVAEGNAKYKDLLAKGYTLTGVYSRDVCGYCKRVR